MTGQRVAIKANETQKYKRLARENAISEAIAMHINQESKHVLNLVEDFEQDGQTYIVTKFVRGGDLLSYLDNLKVKRLPEVTVKAIFTQIAKGVEHMHERGIVHRDLKHLNIFLSDHSEAPRVKIGDFGLACFL